MAAGIWYHLTGLFWFALAMLPVALPQYGTVRRLAGMPFDRRQLGWSILFSELSWCCNRLVILYANGWNVVCAIAWYVPFLMLVFGKRGVSVLTTLMKLTLSLVFLELCCALLLSLVPYAGLNPERLMVATLEDMHDPHKLLGYATVNLLGATLIWLSNVLWQHLWRLHQTAPPRLRKRRWHIAIATGRLVLLMACAVSMLAMPHYLFGVNSIKEFLLPNRHRYIIMVLSVAMLIAVALSYMAQDIRFLIQSQRLNTLEQQQDISRALLENLRFFRHNIINMLYGLEGTLRSGDREKLDAYFAEIHEKCALVNNENITALEKVTNPAVSTLLMHAVDRARQLSLPLNLYVQEQVNFPHVLGDADLCQIVGVLVDNALEAANAAAERHVSIELRNVDDALEMIVKNTYAGEVTPQLLTQGGTSSKEGHAGQGLASCYHILARKRGAFLNFWVTGQYVQAQLLLHR